MSQPASTYTLRTSLPSGPVWCETSVMPRIALATCFASAAERASLTPPALPRPPACTCAFTTTTGAPSARAACSASAGVVASWPSGTATPYARKSPLAWYSWTFIVASTLELDLGHELADVLDRGVEEPALIGVELDLEHLLDAPGAEHARDADVEPVDAVLALAQARAGEHALLVLQDGLGHLDGARRGRDERGAGLEQVHDLAARVLRALDDGVDALAREQLGDRDPRDRAVAHERHHRVAVAAEDERGHVGDGDAELPGHERAEAGGVQHARHADDPVLREAGDLLERVDHRVERVADHDRRGAGRVLLHAGRHLLHDVQVRAQQVVARHAGLARETGGDDDEVRARDVLVAVRARDARVGAEQRRALRDVERLALRQAFDHVEQDDVAELAVRDELGEDAADVAAADQRDLAPGHAGGLRDAPAF